MPEINERALMLADEDHPDEIADREAYIRDYLTWAERIAADWQGAAKRFLAAEFKWPAGHDGRPFLKWSRDFVGGFDSLDEAMRAVEAKGKATSGERGGHVWDTLTNEDHWSRGDDA